jgi:hypothetical protein
MVTRPSSLCVYLVLLQFQIVSHSIATLSYNNYYVNLRDYSNSLLSGLLQRYGKYPHVL